MWLLLFIFTTLKGAAHGVNITHFDVPEVAFEGHDVGLTCAYDLRGRTLYTLKWYKEEREFYRHEPKARPQFQLLPVPGISVDRKRSNETHVTLTNVRRETSGLFTCEISIEKTFETDAQEATLTVLPSTSNQGSAANRRPNDATLVIVNLFTVAVGALLSAQLA